MVVNDPFLYASKQGGRRANALGLTTIHQDDPGGGVPLEEVRLAQAAAHFRMCLEHAVQLRAGAVGQERGVAGVEEGGANESAKGIQIGLLVGKDICPCHRR